MPSPASTITRNAIAAIAQPVEHIIRNDGVGGSNPSCGTTLRPWRGDCDLSQPDIPFLEIAPPYAVLRIGNPDRANALNEPLIAALNEAMERLDADPSIRAIIFTGAGADVFCSGFDLKALVAGAPLTVTDNPFVHFAGRVLTSPKLTIAAINGAVAGAAVHLVCSCDIRIAVDDATFAVPAGRL